MSGITWQPFSGVKSYTQENGFNFGTIGFYPVTVDFTYNVANRVQSIDARAGQANIARIDFGEDVMGRYTSRVLGYKQSGETDQHFKYDAQVVSRVVWKFESWRILPGVKRVPAPRRAEPEEMRHGETYQEPKAGET